MTIKDNKLIKMEMFSLLLVERLYGFTFTKDYEFIILAFKIYNKVNILIDFQNLTSPPKKSNS